MSNMEKNRLRNVIRIDNIIRCGNPRNIIIPKGYRDNIPSTYNSNLYALQISQAYGSSVSYTNAVNQQNRIVSYSSESSSCIAYNTCSMSFH